MEELIIYKKYSDFIYYVYILIDKLPKVEKVSLGSDIRELLYDNLKFIIKAYKEKNRKYYYLNEFDVNLLIIKNLIRIAYKRKYISVKNYQSFSKKVLELGKIVGGMVEKYKS